MNPGGRRPHIDPVERRLLALDEPIAPIEPFDEDERSTAVAQILGMLGSEPGDDARRDLTAVLTRLPPARIPEPAWPLLDAIWATETAESEIHDPAEEARVALWRGDITTLGADAIVNAANSGLTGCYVPFHRCVDNAIHSAAGPRLREDCGLIARHRGRPEPPGTATATRGWFLPARFVLHTVGPIVDGGSPTGEDEALLGSCYRACLDVASELEDVRTVAFCSISTGVFGYPIEAAAPVAVSTASRWLDEHPNGIEQVVFVVFSATDEAVYRHALAGLVT